MAGAGAGSPEPLGLTLVEGGANVAVVSAHATAIELCVFDAAGTTEAARHPLTGRSGNVFHGHFPGLAAGARYGFRAHGPWDPAHGHRFNPAKLLVDPYARALDRAFAFDPRQQAIDADGHRDDRDSADAVPKAIAVPAFAAAVDTRARVPWSDAIVYELHVRGYTQRNAAIPAALRGTCAGLAHPAAIDPLVRLGVTTVELMPIAAAIDEPHLHARGLRNYWGYNPVALFVPDPRLAPGGMTELRGAVAALQAAGLEVILDVVLNHSGEGDTHGPLLSLAGLDNALYYRLQSDADGSYVDDTGCGNTLALDRPPVLRLAMDVLRHYALAAGVDGFRFDLATTLFRRNHGFDPAAPLMQAMAQDPVLRELKLIAEPWDIGPGGYQLGAFPAPWGEWNDRYRDTVRRFWRGDAGLRPELATRIAGSADRFRAAARAPSRSLNFVAAHDGFTLADVVAFEHKHNDANGEDNRDGTNANHSWNHGVEGPSDDPAIVAHRGRDVRNLLATLLLSRGTPMLTMGDEAGRTQHGNNNAYAQDNELTWLDWERSDDALRQFTRAVIALRRAHPALSRDAWLTGAPVDESAIADVEWLDPGGNPVSPAQWADAAQRTLIAVLYAPAEAGHAADRVLVALHAGSAAVAVAVPAPRAGTQWQLRLDTGREPPLPDKTLAWDDGTLAVAPASVVVLVEAPVAPAAVAARGRRIDAAVLGRLAEAAGIAPDWWEVSGRRHAVAAGTTRALLAAMGFAVDSTDDARAHLAQFALSARKPPRVRVVAADAPVTLLVPVDALVPGRHRAPVVTCEDGQTLRLPPPTQDGSRPEVVTADGRRVAQATLALPPLPAGRHRLQFGDRAESACTLIATPGRCHLPPALAAGGRRFGVAAQLYSLRRPGDAGIGDYTTLGDFAVHCAGAGAATIGVNPLHALFATDRERASPYQPCDRRFLDSLAIDLDAVPEVRADPSARRLLARNAPAIAALAARTLIDYSGVGELKERILSAAFDAFEHRPAGDPLRREFEAFVVAGGQPLADFALFETLARVHRGLPWRRWPAAHARPDAAEARSYARLHARLVRFRIYLQWLADRQLAAADRRARAAGLDLGFYRDLAVGAAPDGAEAWSQQDVYARGASVGAPPDPFSQAGQNWGIPPPSPHALRADAFSGLGALFAANMRHAGGLRIDHAMGLARLFWVPDGADPADGAYVRYPVDELLGVLALESARARCFVVGEDLGTVPEGFRERMNDAGVLSYRVLWFEREGAGFMPAARYPAQSAACASTHDLPTVRGWWTGADIAERHRLGHLDDPARGHAECQRAHERQALCAVLSLPPPATSAAGEIAPDAVAVTIAAHRFIAGTPAALVLVQADDLAGETEAINLPGTDRERPNWRRRIAVDAAALWDTPIGAATRAGLALCGRSAGAKKAS